ncbi:hypothetical protein [Ferroacidibacillus organovorans]|uniref:Uncharacterized protein n=1 Tax=Ferroacidibacillus organovorans TaxID=1765683 RepID=A0A101XQP2_9BACL|nr:hypothetical protein [Ferroacidibacillus organovorans]KUO95770.1 hypothetical protein ATW55_05430 [Ferroacidibacillus organovorans]
MESWKDVALRSDAFLLKKDIFIYRIQNKEYQIEVFEQQSGVCYAIGTPMNEDRMIIYGSAEVTNQTIAISQVIKKIDRDILNETIFSIGEDREDS